VLQYGTFTENVVRLSGKWLQVIFGVDFLRVMQVLYVNEANSMNNMLICKLVSTLRSDEHVRVVID
jgi:hypothetical protein